MDEEEDHTHLSPLITTPINGILLVVFIIIVYLKLRPEAPPKLPKHRPTVFKTFTPRTLLPFNGHADSPIYFAVRGRVFDVTPGKHFYGPGGAYANFAGRDASRGLAHHSFDESMITKDLDGPLDPLSDLKPEDEDSLRGWEERFENKYQIVGKLVAADSPEAKAQGLR